MATSEENILSANGIVRSKQDNDFWCSMCMRDTNFVNWESHIMNLRHIGTLKQFNLVFVHNGDKVDCKACGANFVWESLKSHANWHKILPWYEPHDKDKILFDNHILMWETWKSYYYCFPCTVIFSEWSDVFTHFADDRHKNLIASMDVINTSFSLVDTTISYKILVSEGFEPCGASIVKCTICNFPNIEFQNVIQHIESTRHLSVKLQLMRDLEMQENVLAMQRQAEKHLETSACKEKQNNEQSAGAMNYSNNQNNMHASLNGMGNNAENSARDFNRIFKNNANKGSNGMTKNKPMNTMSNSRRWFINRNNTTKPDFSDSSSKFPVGQRGTERYCTICECTVETTVEYHVAGDEHVLALSRYGYEHIVPKDGVKFDCKSCNCVIPNLENVFRHIKGLRHRNLLSGQKNVTNHQDTTRGKKISFKMNFPPPPNNLTKSSWGSLPPDYIIEQNPKDLFCRICDSVIYGHENAHDHIRGKTHSYAVEDFCATIGTTGFNTFYCKRCNCEILGRDNLYLHIHGGHHAMAVLARKDVLGNTLTTVNKTLITEKEELPASNSVPIAKDSKQPENGLNNIQNYEFIVKLNKTDFCCKICHLVLFDHTNIAKHVAELRHVTASRMYNSNNPSLSENVKYFCNSCRCNIPNFANVYLHTIGGRHKNSLNITNPSLKLPTRSQLGPNWRILARDYIGQVSDTDYNCRICNVPLSGQSSVDDHVIDKSHADTLKKYGCEKIEHIEGNKYNCTWCDCIIPSLDNIYVHVAGRRHLQTVSEKQHMVPMIKDPLDESKIPKLLELNTFPPSSLITTTDEKLIVEASKNVENDRINPKEHQANATEQTLHSPSIARTVEPKICSTNKTDNELPDLNRHEKVIEKMVSEAIECDRMAKSTANSVIHEIQRDFLSDGRQVSPKNSDNGLSLNDSSHRDNVNNYSLGPKLSEVKPFKFSNETITTLNEDGETFRSLASSTLSLNEIGKSGRKRRAPKITSIQRNVQMLDCDNDYIYEMKDKLREIERGMKLCLRTDSNNIYCLICRKKTANTLHNYCEHLWSLDHCEFLEGMEKDHALFEVVPGQFSELDLASHYMEETSEDTIMCHVCNKEMENIDYLLQDHTNCKVHMEKCEEMRLRAGEHFEALKSRILCDWYKIYKYLCVPCSMNFDSELTFVKHLKSAEHASIVKQPENSKQRLIYDFCAPCALLWYGYRCTYVNHCEIPTHKWLIRDENFLSPQLPTSAKCLLAMPEEYIQDTMKYFDEISTKELGKEKILIHDIEKAAKSDFPDAKAYTFGSRVSGLDSLNSDIEVFLDCGNMYDRTDSSQDRISYVKTIVSDKLRKDPQSWDMEELLTQCRSSTVKARHRATGLACHIHFENGLGVESTNLIKAYNDAYPLCRNMIIFLKQWLEFCGLPASEFITIDALCWCVIFYLQHVSIVPTIAELIEFNEESHIIAGWEVGVSLDFTCNQREGDLTIKDLLIRFFTFYANFDYRYNVVCPLISKEVKKRTFANPERLPKEMRPYIDYIKNSNNPEPFRFDSAMCIQDPFCLRENLTKAVSKVNLSRFRTYCFKSLDILDVPSSQ